MTAVFLLTLVACGVGDGTDIEGAGAALEVHAGPQSPRAATINGGTTGASARLALARRQPFTFAKYPPADADLPLALNPKNA